MEAPYRERRKIDPTRGARLADGTPNDNDRMEIGPTQLAFTEWAAAGLVAPDLERMRAFRHKRLVDAVNARDYGAILMFDPLNIRYATDSTNMQLWNTHNAFRACLVCADGHMVVWDYKNAMFLSKFNHLVKEQRSGADFFYFDRGDKIEPAADLFSNEVRQLLKEHAGGNLRIGARIGASLAEFAANRGDRALHLGVARVDEGHEFRRGMRRAAKGEPDGHGAPIENDGIEIGVDDRPKLRFGADSGAFHRHDPVPGIIFRELFSYGQQEIVLAGKVQVYHAAGQACLFKYPADRYRGQTMLGDGIRRRLDQGAPVPRLGLFPCRFGLGHSSHSNLSDAKHWQALWRLGRRLTMNERSFRLLMIKSPESGVEHDLAHQ